MDKTEFIRIHSEGMEHEELDPDALIAQTKLDAAKPVQAAAPVANDHDDLLDSFGYLRRKQTAARPLSSGLALFWRVTRATH